MSRKPTGVGVPTALQRRRLSAALVINHTAPVGGRQYPIPPISRLEIIEAVDFYASKKTQTPSP